MKTTLYLLCSLLFLGLDPTGTFAGDAANEQNTQNQQTIFSASPFTLPKDRIVPGTAFSIDVAKDFFEKGSKIIALKFIYMGGESKVKKEFSLDTVISRKSERELYIESVFPQLDAIKDIREASTWRGISFPYKGNLKLEYATDKGIAQSVLFPVLVPSVKWAAIWGVGIILSIFILLALLRPVPVIRDTAFAEVKDKSGAEWMHTKHRKKRFFLYPLNFAITPMATYSISLTQIMIWTYVTIFGLVYVYRLTGTFLDITPQVLILLGIGGGTAIGSKINAISKTYEIPAKFKNLVERKRIPRLRDIVTTNGRPNIYKFQMLVFTLLTAFIVLMEIVMKYSFPAIPDSLISLMGISSAVYLGNEVTKDEEGGKLEEKIKAIKEHPNYLAASPTPATAEDIEALNIPEVEELKNILKSIYA